MVFEHTLLLIVRNSRFSLFKQMKLYELSEVYHCDRILAHLGAVNKEFQEASTRVEDIIEDGLMTKTINNLEKKFQDAENNHKIGPSNHGTSRTPAPGTSVNLAKAPGQQMSINDKRPTPNRQITIEPTAGKDKRRSYPKGLCSIHKFSTTHLEKDCQVKIKRDNFVHPVTAKRGLSPSEICPLCPTRWHPAELPATKPRKQCHVQAEKVSRTLVSREGINGGSTKVAAIATSSSVDVPITKQGNNANKPSAANANDTHQHNDGATTSTHAPKSHQAQMAHPAQPSQQILDVAPLDTLRSQLSSGRY